MADIAAHRFILALENLSEALSLQADRMGEVTEQPVSARSSRSRSDSSVKNQKFIFQDVKCSWHTSEDKREHFGKLCVTTEHVIFSSRKALKTASFQVALLSLSSWFTSQGKGLTLEIKEPASQLYIECGSADLAWKIVALITRARNQTFTLPCGPTPSEKYCPANVELESHMAGKFLPREDFYTLFRTATYLQFGRDSLLLEIESHLASPIMITAAGRVRIEDSQGRVLSVLNPGTFFGLPSVLPTDVTRTSLQKLRVVADSDEVQVYRLTLEEFQAIMADRELSIRLQNHVAAFYSLQRTNVLRLHGECLRQQVYFLLIWLFLFTDPYLASTEDGTARKYIN